MTELPKGKIFLASDRGHTETGWFRSYATFNFGAYQSEHKNAFGDLYVLNDDTLAGGKSVSLAVESDSQIFLLPTVGAIRYKDDNENDLLLEAGQYLPVFLLKNTTFQVFNAYEDDLINFIQLWFKAPVPSVQKITESVSFDIEANKNRLIEIFSIPVSSPAPSLFIGKFDGRKDAMINLVGNSNAAFFFVLEGAFEVADRLLETRDGLALWDIKDIELEALSANAILLVITIRI
jgi:hypothetical protein